MHENTPQPAMDSTHSAPAPVPILEMAGVKKYFPVRSGFFQGVSSWIRAVDGVDLSIETGRTLGLVGESGCGKSTLARLILRLLDPDSGSIRFCGTDIATLDEKGLKPVRKQIQIVFQDPYGSLNPRMTVAETIEEGLRVLGLPRGKRRRERRDELLTLVGIVPESADRYPHEFSGGQRQRIGIARALSVAPSMLVCDEPVSALDVSIQAQIINLLKDLQTRLGLSYLFISHDLNVVGYLCDRVCVMYGGRIVESAPTEAIFETPAHPYTRILLAAIPPLRPGTGAVAEAEVTGQRADAMGCAFAHRCAQAENRCRNTATDLVQIGPDHWVRCWKAQVDIAEKNL